MSAPLPTNGLYAVTPTILNQETLLASVDQALSSGIALLQYRDKTSQLSKKLATAIALQQLCQQYDTPLIINDDAQLALDSQAAGVHLGQGDGSVKQARKLLGQKAIIGVTCHHDLSLALIAQQEGADYVAFGRFFHSQTKPGKPLADVALLVKAKIQLDIPIVCIGGIKPSNSAPLINAGANYLAVIDSLFSTPSISKTSQEFATLFTHSR